MAVINKQPKVSIEYPLSVSLDAERAIATMRFANDNSGVVIVLNSIEIELTYAELDAIIGLRSLLMLRKLEEQS